MCCISAQGQKSYTVDDVPDVHRLDGARYVSDPEGILTPVQVRELNTIAARLERSTGVESAVVIVPSIGNGSPEDFTVRLFQKWGIGKKGKDTGLLIFLSTGDRVVRFEVGYGLEGVLTDAMSKRIQTQRMTPDFARGDWGGGLIAGLSAVEELLTDPSSELLAAQGDMEAQDIAGALMVIGFMVLMVIFVIVASRKARKCPRCGHRMKVTGQTSKMVSPGIRMITTHLRCPNCGYTTTRNTTQNIGAAVAGGTIAGGLGRRPGGSFGGGGWGGGRSGGGGATSRF